jgi:hypothetical protein
MSYFSPSTSRRKQPQISYKVNHAHPLAKGLKALFVATPTRLIDVLSPTQFPTDTSARGINSKHIKRTYTSSSTSSIFTNNTNYGLASPLTIAAILDVDTLTDYGGLIACQNDPTSNGWELRLGNGVTDSNILFHRSHATDFRQHTSGADRLTAGTQNNCVIVSSTSNLIEVVPTFIINGVAYTGIDNGAGGGTGAQIASTANLYIGKRSDDVTIFYGGVSIIALWNKALPIVACELFRYNPWALFANGSRTYLDQIAAGPAATFLPTRALTGVGY